LSSGGEALQEALPARLRVSFTAPEVRLASVDSRPYGTVSRAGGIHRHAPDIDSLVSAIDRALAERDLLGATEAGRQIVGGPGKVVEDIALGSVDESW